MTQTRAKPSKRRELPAAQEIGVPLRDYQPTKAETEREYDMPGASLATVRRAFFRPFRAREKTPETD